MGLVLGGLILRQGGVVAKLDQEEIAIGIEADWTRFCLSSQYEIPDTSNSSPGRGLCWQGKEVAHNTIFLTYLLSSGGCVRQSVKGDFLTAGNSETRCFGRDEIEGETLIREGNVFRFR